MADLMEAAEEDPVKSWYDQIKFYPGIYRANLEKETGRNELYSK